MTARKRKTTKRRRGQFYIALEFWELECPAFAHLSADATRVYLFMRKRLNFDNGNNGAVPFSHRDAAKALNTTGRHRAGNALAELQHFGFIKRRENGRPAPYVRLASEWQLTAFECSGQPASKDFMRWEGEVFEPPFKGHLGKRTMEKRRAAEKRLPIANVATRRSHVSYAYPEAIGAESAQNAQSVAKLATPPAHERGRVSDTSTVTTQRGPLERPWSAPTYHEPPIEPSERQQPIRPFLRAPKGSRRDKAEWLRAHLDAGVLTTEAVASALEIQPAHVDEIALGKSEIAVTGWRRLTALAAERLH
jgi:hypothetical protein